MRRKPNRPLVIAVGALGVVSGILAWRDLFAARRGSTRQQTPVARRVNALARIIRGPAVRLSYRASSQNGQDVLIRRPKVIGQLSFDHFKRLRMVVLIWQRQIRQHGLHLCIFLCLNDRGPWKDLDDSTVRI